MRSSQRKDAFGRRPRRHRNSVDRSSLPYRRRFPLSRVPLRPRVQTLSSLRDTIFASRILAQLFRYGLDHPAELLQVESVRDVAFIVKPNVSGAVDQIELREGLRFIKLFDAAIAEENREIVSSLLCKLGCVSFVGIR